MLCGNLTHEDKNRDAPWTHLKLFNEPLGQYTGNSWLFTAKKGGHAFGHSLHTARGIAAGYANWSKPFLTCRHYLRQTIGHLDNCYQLRGFIRFDSYIHCAARVIAAGYATTQRPFSCGCPGHFIGTIRFGITLIDGGYGKSTIRCSGVVRLNLRPLMKSPAFLLKYL